MDESAVGKLIRAKRIAVVGISANPERDSHNVARYLQAVGKEVVPVNPNLPEVLGLKCYPTLREVPGRVDLVNVFRKPEALAEVTREAVSAGALGVWIQLGLYCPESRKIAAEGGLWYVEDRCIMIEHRQAVESQFEGDRV